MRVGLGDQEQGVGGALEGECALARQRADERHAGRVEAAGEERLLVVGDRTRDDELQPAGCSGSAAASERSASISGRGSRP